MVRERVQIIGLSDGPWCSPRLTQSACQNVQDTEPQIANLCEYVLIFIAPD